MFHMMSFLLSLSSWTLKIVQWVLEINFNQSYSGKICTFIFMIAILNFWQMSTSHDNGSGTIEKLDPENMGIAVGILLLCALELEICLGAK